MAIESENDCFKENLIECKTTLCEILPKNFVPSNFSISLH